MQVNRLFKLGEDAEYFLLNDILEPTSAIPHFSGTKENPTPLPCGLGGVLHDNVLVESNTKPATSREDFITKNLKTLNEIKQQAKEKGVELCLRASMDFPLKELDNPEAKILGCNPDYNAWRLDWKGRPIQNPKPDLKGIERLRTAGGHLHIGAAKDKKFADFLRSDVGRILAVRVLDCFVGIPSVIVDNLEGSARRRLLYGRAGSFRPKDYGVEYRVISPWWKQSAVHLGLVYDLVNAGLWSLHGNLAEILAAKPKLTELDDCCDTLTEILGEGCIGSKEMQKIIDDGDRDEAYYFYMSEVACHLPESVNSLVTHELARVV